MTNGGLNVLSSEFSMEFCKYQAVPRATQEQMIKEFKEKQEKAKK